MSKFEQVQESAYKSLEKKNEGYSQPNTGLFLLFSLFIFFFWSFRHAINLKATVVPVSYLKFANP